MKILQIGPIPPEIGGKTRGGVANHLWELSIHLVKRGHKVAILADNFLNPPQNPAVREGVKVYGFSKASILRHLPSVLLKFTTIYRLKKHLKGLMGIRKAITNFCYYEYVLRHFRPDIIHIHHLEYRFPFAYFVTKGRLPLVTTIHSFHSLQFSPPTQSQKYHKLVTLNLKLAQNLIFVSHSLERQCKELFKDYKAKSWVIHSFVDTTRYGLVDKKEACRRIGLSSEIPNILFVGNLVKRKGIYNLLKAVTILKRKSEPVKVIIVGEGPERDGVEDFLVKNELNDLVRLEGKKPDLELPYYYNAADLFVMPSFSEGFALAYEEALNCGIPVIGCSGVADEAIQDNEYGLLVPPGDSAALANAIEKGLNKKWNRAKILAYGKSFDWDTNIHKFEKLYNELLNANSETLSPISLENVLPKNVDIVNREDFVLSQCSGKKVFHLGAVDSGFLRHKIKKDTLFHFKLMSDPLIKSVVGIDLDQEGIQILGKYGINNIIYGNLEKLDEVPLDKKFDIIIASEIIEHLSNPGIFLQGIKRFFHENTEMIITTPNAFSYIRFHHVLLNKELVHPDHKCWYSYTTLKKILQNHGFKITKFLLYTYRDTKLIDNFSPKILLNKSVWLRKIWYKISPFFADGLIFVVKLDNQHKS